MTYYVYTWGNNQVRSALKGQKCVVIARGRMNSVDVLFCDGTRHIVSRNAIRKVKAV